MWIVSSGNPACPYLRATVDDSIVPTVRLMLRIGVMKLTRSPFSSAGRHCSISLWSSAFASPWSCVSVTRRATSAGIGG